MGAAKEPGLPLPAPHLHDDGVRRLEVRGIHGRAHPAQERLGLGRQPQRQRHERSRARRSECLEADRQAGRQWLRDLNEREGK